MSPGIQEAIALAIVLVVVGFGLYRRWRKGKQQAACCDSPPEQPAEKTVRFYRRDDP